MYRDGLLLLNKHAHYQIGPTPLALLWKDNACSRYFIDTDADGIVREHQVLYCQQERINVGIDGVVSCEVASVTEAILVRWIDGQSDV